MEQPNVDTREAARRIDEVEEARSKLEKTRATMFLEIRRILTPEQRQKARDLQDRLHDRRQQRPRGLRERE
jgi:Spy/CpxP family protein refolding chaperone